MEIRFQPALSQPTQPRPVAVASDPAPRDTVELRRPGWLGIGWRSATPEEARQRLAEGKTVEVRDQSWVRLEQPDDLTELEYFRGQNPQAPADFGKSLKDMAAQGARFATQEGELGPFGAYHELESGRPVELTLGERKIPLAKPEDALMAAYFHELGPAPNEQAATLRTLYRTGLDLGGSPVDPPRPVRVKTAEGVELLLVEDLTKPLSGAALKLSARLGEYAALARLDPRQLAALEKLAALKEPMVTAQEPWKLESGTWSCKYRDNEDSSLSFEPVKLGQDSRLELTAAYALEDNCDRVGVEARQPGGKWQSLASFTGRSEWRNHSLDLSAYDGQDVELRLRTTSDSSRTDDGFQLKELRLISGGRVLTGTDRGTKTLEDLARRPPPAEELEAIVQDAGQCGLGPALALHEAGLTGLGSLAAEVGLTPAMALRDPQAGPWLELARKLAPKKPESEQLALAAELGRRRVEPGPFLELERTLRSPSAWQAEGQWKVTETDEGRVWRHGPYPDNASLALTTPEFRVGKRLSYRLKTGLESGCDHLVVEGRAPGGSSGASCVGIRETTAGRTRRSGWMASPRSASGSPRTHPAPGKAFSLPGCA